MQQSEPKTARPPYRWVMLGLVWLLYFSFGLVQASLAPLLSDVKTDLEISDALIGGALAAWPLVYIFFAIPSGSVIERLGIRKALIAAGLLMALSQMLRAFSFDFVSLSLAIGIFGIGGPLISIGAPATVARWFDADERATALGIYSTAPALGTMLALSSANAVVMPVTGYDWRLTLVVFGSVALLASLACAIFAREPPTTGEPVAAGGTTARFLELARGHSMQVVLLLSVGVFLFIHGSGNWLPELLRREGMSKSEAGLWATLPTVIGVIAALTLPRLARGGQTRPYLVLGGVFLAGAAAAALIPLTGGAPQTLGLMLLGIGRSAPLPLMMLIMMALPSVGPRNMGIAGGLYFTTGEIGGVLGPLLVGLIAQASTLANGYYMLAVAGVSLLLPVFLLKHLHEREVAQSAEMR